MSPQVSSGPGVTWQVPVKRGFLKQHGSCCITVSFSPDSAARAVPDRQNAPIKAAMMARWDVAPLLRNMAEIDSEVLLLTGARDGTVEPAVSRRAAGLLPNATYRELPGLGHLAHEEDAGTIADAILDFVRVGSISTAAE